MTFGYQCDEPTSVSILNTAFENGVTFIDTADAYPLGGPREVLGSTEEILGRWLATVGRDNVILATKCYYPSGPNRWDFGSSRKNIMRAIDASLRRLDTDYIDLYQLHSWDADTPIDESLGALDDLVRSGKVRYIGCSNFVAYQIARSLGRSEVLRAASFVSVQPRYNLLYREIEREMLPMCLSERLAVIPYNPIAGGMLSGKHRFDDGPTQGSRFTLGNAAERYQGRYWRESLFNTVADLKAVADEAGMSLVQMSVAWTLANPAITAPIIGASRPEQLAESLAAASAPLDAELKAKLDSMTAQYRLVEISR